MKFIKCLLACIAVYIAPAADVKAQCGGSITPTLITHDSTVVGVGSAPYQFTFPKFNPSLGTLTEVRIQSVVTLRYQFSLENRDAGVRNVRHKLRRYDDIFSSVLAFPIDNTVESPWYGWFSLQSADADEDAGPDHISVGPVYIVNNDTLINERVYNTADFMGPGNVVFDYNTSAGTEFGGTASYDGAITDIVKFNITYVFCSANVLVSNSILLNAEHAGATSSKIRWSTNNEVQVKSYELMVSEDGTNYTTAATVPASGRAINGMGSYEIDYSFSSPKQKAYFRIKQILHNNKVLYSTVKAVTWLKQSDTISIYPDASGTYIHIHLPQSGVPNWRIALYNANGQVMQSSSINNSVTKRVPIQKKLGKGIYIVQAVNVISRETIAKKIYID
jgi:hypothetical protein